MSAPPQLSHGAHGGVYQHAAGGSGGSDPYFAGAGVGIPSMQCGGGINGDTAQMDALLLENERLHQELEVQVEKTARLQKVRSKEEENVLSRTTAPWNTIWEHRLMGFIPGCSGGYDFQSKSHPRCPQSRAR